MLCLHPLDTAKRLKHQIDMSGKMYKDLVVTLYEGKKDFGNAINFYMAAARDFLGEPLLLIVPQHCTDKANPGLKYEFEKMYAFKEDSYLAESEIKLRFVYNRIDYYAPFFQTSIAQIIRVGTPLLKSIKLLIIYLVHGTRYTAGITLQQHVGINHFKVVERS